MTPVSGARTFRPRLSDSRIETSAIRGVGQGHATSPMTSRAGPVQARRRRPAGQSSRASGSRGARRRGWRSRRPGHGSRGRAPRRDQSRPARDAAVVTRPYRPPPCGWARDKHEPIEIRLAGVSPPGVMAAWPVTKVTAWASAAMGQGRARAEAAAARPEVIAGTSHGTLSTPPARRASELLAAPAEHERDRRPSAAPRSSPSRARAIRSLFDVRPADSVCRDLRLTYVDQPRVAPRHYVEDRRRGQAGRARSTSARLDQAFRAFSVSSSGSPGPAPTRWTTPHAARS